MTFPWPVQDNPDLYNIYYDDNLGKFRDINTGRFVSNLSGIQTLVVERSEGQTVFLDQFGTEVPDIQDLIPKKFDIPFIDQLREADYTAGDVYDVRAPSGSYYLTMATYTDDNGKLRMTLVASKGGAAINADDERRRIAAAVANDTGLEMGAKGTDKIINQVMSIWHFTVTKS